MTATWLSSGGKPFNFGVKPSVPSIDWSNPLTNRLLSAVDYARPGGAANRELVGNIQGALTGTTSSVGPYGALRSFNGNTDLDLYNIAPSQFATGTQVSGEVLFKNNGANSGGNGNTVLVKGNTFASPFFNIRVNPGTPGNIEFFAGWNGSFAYWDFNGFAANTGQWYHVVVTYDYGSTSNAPILYVNSVQYAATVGQAPTGSATADDGFLYLGNASGGTRGLNGDISHGRIWGRILSPQEVLSLYQNPWQVYRAAAPLTALSGGVSYKLNAAQGSIAESGQAASLKAGRLLSAAQGSAVLSGQAATLRHGYTLAAGQATFTATGEAVLFGVNMPVAQGSFGFSGQAANLVWTTAGAHNFALTSGFGSFNLTGEPAIPKAARKFGASNGAVSLAGKAVGLVRGKTVGAAQGSFSFSGKAVSFHAALSIKAQCGTVALASEAAGLIRSGWSVVDPTVAMWTPGVSDAPTWSQAITEEKIWTPN